ncbi:major facilitator superfamily domain-containing protein [Dactylonectria macrodidyma]|uniref:Major facilitator superfamily domain-containing protein n=1 Tax=Dactylonectria macrodidyma TaxID=307937 RepID=A0A9P9JBP2_9HYPO|nr:major facilitator superfamily domain-containing protein [Dactylonectria macrodidyma]
MLDLEQDVKNTDYGEDAQRAVVDDTVYPSGLKLAFTIGSVFVSMFLVSLDRMIIATATPQITDEFHSVTDIGWYGSAFLLTTCAFQLLFGKIYSFYSIKYTFLASVFLFEAGSALCGAAPSSVVFIVGRAIAGLGSAGILSGVMVVIVHCVPLHKRPLYQGMFGAVFGVSSILGPLLGGVFTTKLTWRWCFYINLPFGAVAMVVIFFLLSLPHPVTAKLSTMQRLAQLDMIGTALIVPGTICLLLALQWGGSTYSWSDGRIEALLVLAGLLLLGFVMVQVLLPKTATVPPRIFKQRSIISGFFSTTCVGSQMVLFVYFLPVWFQAIQGISAVDSGIRTLPLVLSMVIASISTGVLVHRIGYYTPFIIVGVCFMSVGAGLLNTLQMDTSTPKLVGYQILYGWGMGCVAQVPNIAAQTVLPKPDVAIGGSLMFFSQTLGGAIFVSVGQNVLTNQLIQRLSSIPGFDREMILKSGATSLTDIPESIKNTVLSAYNESLRQVFMIGLILVCLTMIGALTMEWRSTKEHLNRQKLENEKAEGRD